MKKLLLSLALALGLGTTLSAQFRIEAGVNASEVKLSALSYTDKSDLNIGYRVGAAYEIKLLPVVYIAPGLQLRTSGSFDKNTDIKMTNTDIALPVMVGARLPLGLIALSAEVGPYASYTVKSSTSSSKLNNIFGGYIDGLRGMAFESEKFRYGIGGSVALHISKGYLRVGADYDLKNTYKPADNIIGNIANAFKDITGDNIKTRNLSVYATLGIRL